MGARDELFQWVRCGRCDLVYLNPRVPASLIGEYYRDYLPHRGPSAWGRWAALVAGAEARVDQARLRTLQRLGPLTAHHAVLDVGCGRPSFLRLVQQATGARSVGIDFDDSGWGGAPEAWPGLELHAGILESLDVRGPFDRFTLWHVVEHLYDPVATLRHLRGLARPGASMVIEVPDHSSPLRRRQGGNWAGYHTPRHTAAYTPRTLFDMVERAGWRVVKQYRWGTLDPWVLWWLGEQERLGRDLTQPLESRFLPFLAGKIATLPLTMLSHWLPLGFQTAVAVI
jgi:SAM-dependent methyltransferase